MMSTTPEPPSAVESDNPAWCNVFGDNQKGLPCCETVDKPSGGGGNLLPEPLRPHVNVTMLDTGHLVTV